jgi:hypothetical protein
LKQEHDELSEQFRKAITESGNTVEAPKAVAKVMHPHLAVIPVVCEAVHNRPRCVDSSTT